MLNRKAYDRLLEWKKSHNKKALIITGARQIGKTFIVREFGKKNYSNFVEINFIADPKAAVAFESGLDAETIITNLTALARKSMDPGNTLIFFDEIQECPNARTAIKFLVEDGRFDYIESGSLLGVSYKEIPSLPVGYEEALRMYPLDFEEFLYANGVPKDTVDYLEKCFFEGKQVSTSVHDTIIQLFRYFLIVGGMPAAVQSFVETHDTVKVANIQKNILELYRQDITKYSETEKIRIKDIFDRIPSELSAKNKRFMLADIDKNARMNRYESSFVWLSDAGVSLPCYNVSQPKIPLAINQQHNLFKLYLNDVGLLCSASMENVQFDILRGNLEVNMGSILENAVAQLLKANGFSLRYYDKKNLGEVDFIVQQGKNVLPIEVKSGSDYKKHTALNNLLNVKEWSINKSYVLCQGNIEEAGNVTYLPWYMIMFIKQETLPKHLVVDVDLSGLNIT